MLQCSSSIVRPSCSFRQAYSHNSRLSSASAPAPLLRFRTSYRDNIRYLLSIGLADAYPKLLGNPSPGSLDRILCTVNFLKSRGFSESDFPRLAFLIPRIFSPQFEPTDLQPVFDFLTDENYLAASPEDACGLILRCPHILEASVEFCLKPTLFYLTQEIGIANLSAPTNLNAHLLNTRVNKLQEKVKFLQSIGFSYEEATKFCARLPAIFGYSIESNLSPKFQYLVRAMGRNIDELKNFPQYFAFSLEKRIAPRHRHLQMRNIQQVKVPLNRMLLWSDKRFYAKWK